MPGPIRVVHVDDDPEFAALTAESLERHDPDFAVDTERRARDAIDRLDREQYDCVVSDYEMPGMDGLAFLETVRDRHGDVPFVLFTGKGSEEIASEAISAGVTDYLQKSPQTEQYELLANRVRNAVEAHRAERRADKHARINAIVNDVNQALVRARSRTEIETAVCDIVSASDPYAFAWIGAYDPESGNIVPRESAGDDDGYLDAVSVRAGDELTDQGPAGTAIRTREIQLTQDVEADPAFEPWSDPALERDFRAVAAVPLVYDATPYGILSVYADRPNAFDDTEVALLEELADDVAHALYGIEVREELEWHETLIQASGDPVFALDADGRFTFVNAAFEDLTGYDEAELAGTDAMSVVAEESVETTTAAFESLRERDRGTARFEIDVTTPDDSHVPCEIHIARLPSTEGFRGITGIARDVTHQKAREAELQAQAEKIERLHDVATTLDGYDDPQAVYERLVAAAEDILEFDLCIADAVIDEELVPQAVSSDVPREGYYETTPVETENNLAARTYRTGEASIVDDLVEEGVDPAADAYRSVLTVPIGDQGVFQAVARDVGFFDEDDRELVELLVAHGRQAVRRIEREEALESMHTAARALMDAETPTDVSRRAVRTLEYVLDRSIAGIWLYDEPTGTLEPAAWTEEADAVFEDIPTFTPENSLSGRAYETGEMRVFDAAADGDEVYNPETPLRTELVLPLGDHGVMNVGALEADAFTEWERSIARTFAANTETALDRATHTDELASRRRELARQNERLEQFANVVSHDLRNPLTTAIGHVHLARDAAADDEVTDHLDTVQDAHDRMDDLIGDLLRLAREGQVIDDREPVDLGGVVRDAWQTAGEASAELTTDDGLGVVQGDRQRLQAVFENLFRNALEHGGSDVTIEVGRLENGFYVEDDGSGLPDADHADLLGLGYSTGDGTGYGLAIVDEIVDAHGWTVAPTDAESGGARFEVTGVGFVSDAASPDE